MLPFLIQLSLKLLLIIKAYSNLILCLSCAALYGGSDIDVGLLSDGVREALSQVFGLFNLTVNGLAPGTTSSSSRGQAGPHLDHSHRYNNTGRVT